MGKNLDLEKALRIGVVLKNVRMKISKRSLNYFWF
jgi:hypothetical protein